MKTDDEILNRYIDGELSVNEVLELEKELDASPALRGKLNLLRQADRMFRQMKPSELPADFTSDVMSRIRKKKSAFRNSQYLFFYVIAGIFIISSLGFTIYSIVSMLSSPAQSSTNVPDMSGYLTNFTDKILYYIQSIFNQGNFSVLGSLVAVTLIVSGYFFFENLKQFKRITK